MKQVSFEQNGQKSVIGRLAAATDLAKRVNASDTALMWWDAPCANENFAPDALPDVGLHADTRVRTPRGVCTVSVLEPGDTVIDHTGAEATVLAAHAAGKTRSALKLRAPYFGLDQDLLIGQMQCLWMISDRAEHMFGVEDVLMPAWALRDQSRVQHVELGPRDVMIEVKLSTGNALMVGNCAVASKPMAGQSLKAYALSESEARGFSTVYRSGFFRL